MVLSPGVLVCSQGVRKTLMVLSPGVLLFAIGFIANLGQPLWFKVFCLVVLGFGSHQFSRSVKVATPKGNRCDGLGLYSVFLSEMAFV